MGTQLDFKRTSRPTFIPHNFRKLTPTTVSGAKCSWILYVVLRRRGVSWGDPGQHGAEHLVSHALIKSDVAHGSFEMGCLRENMVHYKVKQLCFTVEES